MFTQEMIQAVFDLLKQAEGSSYDIDVFLRACELIEYKRRTAVLWSCPGAGPPCHCEGDE